MMRFYLNKEGDGGGGGGGGGVRVARNYKQQPRNLYTCSETLEVGKTSH